MRYSKILILTVFISFSFSKHYAQIQVDGRTIIPIPSKQIFIKGEFILNNSKGIQFDKEFEVAANFLKSYIESGSDIQLQENNDISFLSDKSIQNPEGYKLEVTSKQIIIKASTGKGAFYAVQTLRQLLPAEFENGNFVGNEISIQSQSIEDSPQFQYRGMHLDVCRHMFTVEFIKKYIDALAMLKFNTFHWHLTDDQGWRIEIKKYPKLQEVAAYRKETLIGHYNTQPQRFDGKRYGGFYTQDQIKDVVAYAQSRFVTIIPEIEMPGHARAAIAAYPELGCTGEQVEVATTGGVFEEIFCPKEETFTFLENVLDEVIALFPSTYIHIGGDEAPKTRWKNSEYCQALIKKEGLKDEHGLQSYFISRIETYLNSKGRQIIGWDEILEGGLAPNATVMSWRGFEGAIEAAKQQHNVILTPGSYCYFDHYQSEDKDEPLAIGGFLPLEKVYRFNPIPEELTPEESKYVLGAQANLWTEYIPTSEKVEYMIFPRILAMSEVVWSNPKERDYKEFVSRVEHFFKRLDALNINYANHLYEIQGEVVSNENNISFLLQTSSEIKTIRFTMDGSVPTLNSEIYSKPIPIKKNTIIKAGVFNTEKQLGTTFSQSINLHKAVGKKISINVEPNKSYPGSGAVGLLNGISGSDTRFGDKEWLGFWGDDLEITIDLGAETEIGSIETRFHNGNGQWIYAPKFLTISYDGNKASRIDIPKSEDLLVPVHIMTTNKAKIIKMTIPNYGIIPEGKQGSGNKAWTFIDEIIVK
ncbi:MAG: family 20 glycosylhydrolase [Aquaticitalea sp.]